MARLNLAVVGLGSHAANHHVRHLVENYSDEVKVVAIADILEQDRSLVVERQNRLGLIDIPCYLIEREYSEDPDNTSSLERLFEEHSELDAVIVSTPHTKHYSQIKRCLEAGQHVFVDKPFVLEYEQAKGLVDLAHSCNRHLIVGSQRRYEDVYRYAKKVTDNGELGRLINVDVIASHADDWLKGWHAEHKWAGGGVLWGTGWHSVDTVVYLVDKKAIAVDGSLFHNNEEIDVETHATALLHFEGGLSVTLTVNHNAPRNAVYERVQLWGTRGTLILERFKPVWDREQPKVTHQMSDGRLVVPDLSRAIPKPWAPVDAFAGLLLSEKARDHKEIGESVLSTGLQSVETVRIIEAIYTSAEECKRVVLAG